MHHLLSKDIKVRNYHTRKSLLSCPLESVFPSPFLQGRSVPYLKIPSPGSSGSIFHSDVHRKHLGTLLNANSPSAGPGWSMRVCASRKLWGAWHRGVTRVVQCHILGAGAALSQQHSWKTTGSCWPSGAVQRTMSQGNSKDSREEQNAAVSVLFFFKFLFQLFFYFVFTACICSCHNRGDWKLSSHLMPLPSFQRPTPGLILNVLALPEHSS